MLPALVAAPASAYEPGGPPPTPPTSAAAEPALDDPSPHGPGAPPAAQRNSASAEEAGEESDVPAATDTEKIQAATIAGLDINAPSNPIGLNDRDFTFELWLAAKAGTEVRGTALLSLGDWDPEAQICVSCTLYIRQGVKEAQQRDTANEVRDRQTAQAAESRRQQAADMVEIAVAPRLIASSDRDFTISVWDYLTKEKPRFTATIAAAQAAFTGDAAKAEAFLTGALATAFAADQRRIIEEDTAGDLAAKAEAERRFARKYAANVVGISVRVDDAAWMTTEDPIFLRDVYRKIQGNQFWTLTYQALANEVLNGTDETARLMINTGIFDLVERDRVRRNQEIMKGYKDYVTWVRDDAVWSGYKNVARAATVALATNSIAKLVDFIQKRDTLPADSSELTLLHKVGTSVQIRTRSEIGRWVSRDRLLWKSAAGAWNFANSRIITGDFDGDSKRDAFLLHWGTTSMNGWFLTNIDGTVRAPASVWISNADSAGKNYELKNMAVGDFNGDGRSELAIFAKNKAAKPVILHLSKPVTGNWASKEYASTDALIAGRHVAGDVNNDQKEDIITLQQDTTKGLQMWVGLSTATGLGTAVAKWS
ncbi:MAG TPA: VCBS repeat-containing protein, partial [Actinoplanes sp.]